MPGKDPKCPSLQTDMDLDASLRNQSSPTMPGGPHRRCHSQAGQWQITAYSEFGAAGHQRTVCSETLGTDWVFLRLEHYLMP